MHVSWALKLRMFKVLNDIIKFWSITTMNFHQFFLPVTKRTQSWDYGYFIYFHQTKFQSIIQNLSHSQMMTFKILISKFQFRLKHISLMVTIQWFFRLNQKCNEKNTAISSISLLSLCVKNLSNLLKLVMNRFLWKMLKKFS